MNYRVVFFFIIGQLTLSPVSKEARLLSKADEIDY